MMVPSRSKKAAARCESAKAGRDGSGHRTQLVVENRPRIEHDVIIRDAGDERGAGFAEALREGIGLWALRGEAHEPGRELRSRKRSAADFRLARDYFGARAGG